MRHDAAARLGKPKTTADEKFLERPPATRPDFVDSDPWRALRILSEFVEGFDALAGVGPAVTMFGSARVGAGTPMYELARDIAHKLAASGFAIITGGGPGVMEAANRGCREGGGLSVGCNIELPHGKVRDFPVILVGRDYWQGMIDWMRAVQLPAGAIAEKDLDLLKLTDDPDEVVEIVRAYAARTHDDIPAESASGKLNGEITAQTPYGRSTLAFSSSGPRLPSLVLKPPCCSTCLQ